MDDCLIIGSQRKLRHTHIFLPMWAWSRFATIQSSHPRDKEGETPIDIVSRSGACAEIIGLLSLTPEEARSLGYKGMARLYAPVAYWNNE